MLTFDEWVRQFIGEARATPAVWRLLGRTRKKRVPAPRSKTTLRWLRSALNEIWQDSPSAQK